MWGGVSGAASHPVPSGPISPHDLSHRTSCPSGKPQPPPPHPPPQPPHMSPKAAAPPEPPDSGPQTDGNSSGKQQHTLARGGHAVASLHMTALWGSPGAQPHSTFAPALSQTCSLWARGRGTEEGLRGTRGNLDSSTSMPRTPGLYLPLTLADAGPSTLPVSSSRSFTLSPYAGF